MGKEICQKESLNRTSDERFHISCVTVRTKSKGRSSIQTSGAAGRSVVGDRSRRFTAKEASTAFS